MSELQTQASALVSSNTVWKLRKAAWNLGLKSAHDHESMRANLNTLKHEIKTFSCDNPKVNVARIAHESYRAGFMGHRVPKDAPEQAWSAIEWYRENISTIFRKRESYYWITNSKNFILLSYLAFALGHGGKPFTFAEHRIRRLLADKGYKISSGTISGFYLWGQKRGFLEIVREGDNRPGCHAATLFRLTNIDELVEAFGMDVPARTPNSHGISFQSYVKRHLKFAL